MMTTFADVVAYIQKTTPDPRLLNELPDELLIEIITYLSPKDRATLGGATRNMHRLTRDRVTLSQWIVKEYTKNLGDCLLPQNSLPANFKLHPKLNPFEVYQHLPSIQEVQLLHLLAENLSDAQQHEREMYLWDFGRYRHELQVRVIIFKFFLQLLDDINVRIYHQDTLLMCAAKKYKDGHLSLLFVKILLNAGINYNLKNLYGKTVIEYAKSQKQTVSYPNPFSNDPWIRGMQCSALDGIHKINSLKLARNERLDEFIDLVEWKKSYDYWQTSRFFKNTAIATGSAALATAAIDVSLTLLHVLTNAFVSFGVLPVAVLALFVIAIACAKHHYSQKAEFTEENAAVKLNPAI